jgi:hypothetical protein
MTSTKKTFIILFAAFLLATAHSSYAQKIIGLQGGISLPMSKFVQSDVEMGIGAKAHSGGFLSRNFLLGAGISYHQFKTKNLSAITNSIIGFSTNLQYFFTAKGFRPYVGIDGGYYMYVRTGSLATTNAALSSTSTANFLGIAPQAGFLYEFTPKLALNVCAKYNLLFSKDKEICGLVGTTEKY